MSDISDRSASLESAALTPRQTFLQAHGFERDPFRFHVTEQAWGLKRSFDGKEPSINTWLTEWCDHFQPPALEHNPSDLPFPLSDDKPILMLSGPPGSGKTALLYHWMERAYQDHSETLVIFYDYSELSHYSDTEALQAYQSRVVVVAIVLHLLRDFSVYRREDVQQWLKLLVVIGGVIVQWWIQQLLQKDDPRRTTWQLLRHPLLYPLEITPARRTLLEDVCRVPPVSVSLSGARGLTETITPILEALNIRQFQLFMDNLTPDGLDQEWMHAHFRSIMTEETLYDKKVQRILTVPSELEDYFRNWFTGTKAHASFFTIIIHWSPQQLYSLLRKRCCAEHGWAKLFEGSTESNPSCLEKHIITQATESPRRLLMLVSALLDAHAICTPSADHLTEALWEFVRSHWEFEGSPPEALPKQAQGA